MDYDEYPDTLVRSSMGTASVILISAITSIVVTLSVLGVTGNLSFLKNLSFCNSRIVERFSNPTAEF